MRLGAPLLLVLMAAPAAADPATAVYNHACAWCHGKDGRGDGPAAFSINKYLSPRPRDLTDETGLRIRPADLRYPARFKNGAEPVDVYRTLVTGLDGTPMPSYADAFDDRGTLWDLVAYVGSLARSAHGSGARY